MAFDLFLDPPTFELPPVKTVQWFKWGHLPEQIAYAVAVEEQYLQFHLLLLERAHFTSAGTLATKTWSKPIDFTVRAGIVKAAVLITASIAEAVLRALAEARGYQLPKNEYRRTMGMVLKSWQEPDTSPKAEVAAIWPVLQELHSIRNNVHLFKAVNDPDANFETILAQEADLVRKLTPTINTLASIKP